MELGRRAHPLQPAPGMSDSIGGIGRGIVCLAFIACHAPNASSEIDPGSDAAIADQDDAAQVNAEQDGAAPVDGYVGTGNKFGIGLVGPGDVLDWNLGADLVGPGGYVRVVLPGITRTTQNPEAAWVASVQAIYDRGLVPVVRLAPPWGDTDVRNDSDDAAHLHYQALAAAHRRVVEGLPRRDGLPLWVEVHNEPNLCYEWTCHAGEGVGGSLSYATTAHEYAALLRDVADAVHAIGDPRIRVMNAGLAPGGAASCQCGGDGGEPGVTSLAFLTEMKAAVPDVFARIDGFASHAYPAQGEGWGFFVPYDQAGPGLHWFTRELEIVAHALPVFLTETGWTTGAGATRAQIADWTVAAYRDVWLPDPRIAAVMPFMLRDPAWDAFGWASPTGTHYPVYDAVRAVRCETIPGGCP